MFGALAPRAALALRPTRRLVPGGSPALAPVRTRGAHTQPLVAESFISIAKASGVQALVNVPFPASPRFDACLTDMVVTSAEPSGTATATVTVTDRLANS